MTGELVCLNVGAGDVTISFNRHDKGEREKAVKMLKDMQARGYAILVREEDGTYLRAKEIDAERGCYVLQDLPDQAPVDPATVPCTKCGTLGSEHFDRDHVYTTDGRSRPRSRKYTRRVPIEHAHAVGIARSAGG